MNNSPDNRKWVAFSLSDSTNNQLYSTNLITLRHVNIPYDSALNETEQNKEKKVGVFPIRYIAVLGFQPHENWEALKIRSVFQSAISRYLVSDLTPRRQHRYGPLMFQSAISRYLVSNSPEYYAQEWDTMFQSAISRYLVSNPTMLWVSGMTGLRFNPLYRGTWFPTLPQKHPL